jgi:hypothetical protein
MSSGSVAASSISQKPSSRPIASSFAQRDRPDQASAAQTRRPKVPESATELVTSRDAAARAQRGQHAGG